MNNLRGYYERALQEFGTYDDGKIKVLYPNMQQLSYTVAVSVSVLLLSWSQCD